MATEPAKPGDLITAKLFNEVLYKLDALESRVSKIEGNSGSSQGVVAIDDLRPSNRRRVGEELQIKGRNFAWSIGASRVFINGKPIVIKQTSTDTQLNIEIPDNIPDLPSTGEASLLVANSFTSDSRTIVILPSDLAGGADISYNEVTPANLQTGTNQLFLFEYQIISRASRTATFTLKPIVSIGSWQGSARILNSNKQEDPELKDLAPNQSPLIFYVELKLNPALADHTAFTLQVDAIAEGKTFHSSVDTFRAQEIAPSADKTIELDSPAVDPPATFDGINTIQLTKGGTAMLSTEVRLTVVGKYRLVIDPPSPVSGWGIKKSLDTVLDTSLDHEITQTMLDTAHGKVPIPLTFIITAPANSAQVAVNLGVKNTALTSRQVIPLDLKTI